MSRQACRAIATRAWIGAIPRARYSASRSAKTGEYIDRPQAMPMSASRCSARPWREIRPRRLMLADWYMAGASPVAAQPLSALRGVGWRRQASLPALDPVAGVGHGQPARCA